MSDLNSPAPASFSGLSRRSWWAVAALAGLAGVGTAWWRFTPASVAEGGLQQHLWPLVLETPQGAPLRLADFQNRKLVLNFWATWCPPCVEELPMLNAFFKAQRQRGWQVLGLAVDQAGAVRQFLEKRPLEFPVAMAGMGGIELSKNLGNLNGGLPFTVVIDAQGQVAQRKLGKVSDADLAQWMQLS
jgi:peroxiredoxin